MGTFGIIYNMCDNHMRRAVPAGAFLCTSKPSIYNIVSLRVQVQEC